MRVWHNTTYRLETTLNYGMERCWTLAVSDNSNKVWTPPVRVFSCECVRVRMYARVPVCPCARVCACACARACTY